MLAGLAIVGYVASVLVEAIARRRDRFVRERRSRRAMSEHYIICGYARVGRRIAAEFREEAVPFAR